MPFSDEFHASADLLVRRYPVARSALLPLLHLVQSEHGCVTDEGVAFCAERLDLTKAEVGAVATFYTMFKRQPVGDYLLSVCTNPPCKIAGAQTIYHRYKDALGGKLTDPDTKVTIEEAECLGICDAAPVVQVNYEMYGPLTDEEADRLLDGCRKGQPPVSSWSGEPAPTFAAVERELSGANDAFGPALVAAARHSVVDYDVPPANKSGETDIPVTAPGGDTAGHGGDAFRAEFGLLPPPTAADAAAAAAADTHEGRHGLGEPVHIPGAQDEPDTSGATVDMHAATLPDIGTGSDEGEASSVDVGPTSPEEQDRSGEPARYEPHNDETAQSDEEA